MDKYGNRPHLLATNASLWARLLFTTEHNITTTLTDPTLLTNASRWGRMMIYFSIGSFITQRRGEGRNDTEVGPPGPPRCVLFIYYPFSIY